MASFREASKAAWTSDNSLEHINAGSLQRIADATEKMAASYDAMRASRDYWQGRATALDAETHRLALSIRSLRGVITRLKRGNNGGTNQ